MPKVIKITFKCIKCCDKYTTTNWALRYRDHYRGEHICFKCLIKLRESSNVFRAVPDEFHHQIFDGYVDYKIAVKYLKGVFTKTPVKFKCKKCKGVKYVRWDRFKSRKHYRYDNICQRCACGLINNNPSLLALNRRTSKLLWHNKDYRSKCLRAFELHNKRMQIDPEYANKHRRRSKSISGRVLINGRWIRFDSAYELIFLWYAKDRFKTIRRCRFAIAYGSHFYHPDFMVIDLSGARSIVEIKGFYKNNVIEKQRAARKYIAENSVADSYVLYDTNKLIRDGILLKIGSRYMWQQIAEINNATTIAFADKKHKRIAEIGYQRFNKEVKNKKYIEAAV